METEHDELGQVYRLPVPAPESVKWDDLPQATRDQLDKDFERECRANFDCIIDEVLHEFLSQDHIAKQWAEFREERFQMEMRSVDTQCAYDDWLGERGIV